MMLASVSAWRLRAVARLLLARRAVVRAPSEPEGPKRSCRRGRGSRALLARCHVAKLRLDPQLGACALLPSLWWVAAKGRGLEPRAFNVGPRPPGRWVATGCAPTDPAIKTGNASLPPRGAENRAVGGIPAWAGILAAGRATYRQYSYPVAVT